MSQNILRNNLLVGLFAIFGAGRYAGVPDVQAIGQQSGVDGNALGAEMEAMNNEGLLVQLPEGTAGTTPGVPSFGLTPAGLSMAQSIAQQPAPAPQPVAQAQQPALAPAAQPQAGGTKGGGKKSGGKKGQTQGQAATVEGQPAGFSMPYKLMSALSLAELDARIQFWTLAAEANFTQNQPLVAEGLMRSVSRAQRRRRNLTKPEAGE